MNPTRREWLSRSVSRPGNEQATNETASHDFQGGVVCFSREAMACLFEIQFPEGGVVRKKGLEAFDRIDAIERQLTVYRDDSELSRLNATAHEHPVVVEESLFDLLVECQRWWAETGGAFDVTAGPLIAVWGFKRREGRIPSPHELEGVTTRVGMQHIKLDPRARTVFFDRPGMEINLGGIGKGYALDRVVEQLQNEGLVSALLGAGRSSARAVGRVPGSAGWNIDLADPFVPGGCVGTMSLRDAGLSTTASTEQFFEHNGKRYGHVIDPRTLWPVSVDRQVSVVAPTAAAAEALSTAFFVLGPEWAKSYVERVPRVGAVFVERGADQKTTRIIEVGEMSFQRRPLPS